MSDKSSKILNLPKWAQILIGDLDIKIKNLEHEKEVLNSAHGVLLDHEWFTVTGPCLSDISENHVLFRLYENSAVQVCTLRKGDILLVGRAK